MRRTGHRGVGCDQPQCDYALSGGIVTFNGFRGERGYRNVDVFHAPRTNGTGALFDVW